MSAHSQWLLDRARQSVLAAGAVDWRLLPTGVDQSTFRPGDQRAARAELGLPEDRPILLFAANQARTSGFKDSVTALAAVRRMALEAPDTPYLLVALGEDGQTEPIARQRAALAPVRARSTPARHVLPGRRRVPARRQGRQLPDDDPAGARVRPAGRGDRGGRHPGAGPKPRRRPRRVGRCRASAGRGDGRPRTAPRPRGDGDGGSGARRRSGAARTSWPATPRRTRASGSTPTASWTPRSSGTATLVADWAARSRPRAAG